MAKSIAKQAKSASVKRSPKLVAKPATKSTKAKSDAALYLRGKLDTSARIVMLTKANPKREGSASAKRFSKYFAKGVNTIEKAVAAGLTLADIRWDVAHGHIRLA